MASIFDIGMAVKQLWDIFSEAKDAGEDVKDIITYFQNKTKEPTNSILDAIRYRSKKAYQTYCTFAKSKDLGIPLEQDILFYWESCLNENTLPNIQTLMRHNCSREEAEFMLQCLMMEWLKIPEFVNWQSALSQNMMLKNQGNQIDTLQQEIKSLNRAFQESMMELPAQILEQKRLSDMVVPITWERIELERKKFNTRNEQAYYNVNGNYMQMLPVICSNQDIPLEDALDICMNTILSDSVQPIILTGYGGQGKTSLMLKAAVKSAEAGIPVFWMDLSGGQTITSSAANQLFDILEQMTEHDKILLCIDNPFEWMPVFEMLSKAWGIGNEKIQLMMAERYNRIMDPGFKFYLQNFFDNPLIITLFFRMQKAFWPFDFDYRFIRGKYNRVQKIVIHSLALDYPDTSLETINEVAANTLKDCERQGWKKAWWR